MNQTTKTIASWLGVLIGISGMNHGFFEILQGNTPTSGLIIQAIGPAQRFWQYGTEEAFTIVPNFLITGILAMLVGLAVIVWSLRFMHTRQGAAVFLILCVLLFLVGGGIGQIVFFTMIWLGATRIHSPLTGWKRVLPPGIRPRVARIWLWSLGIGTVLFLFALEIAVFGIAPGAIHPDQRLSICWFVLLGSWLCFTATFVSGFSRDLFIREGE